MKYLKSRTILSAVFLFLLGGFQAVTEFLPAEIFFLIEGVLVALIAYFRSHPVQDFTKKA